MMQNMIEVQKNIILKNKINKEINDEKLLNPFFLIKKYCVV
jgi:hypothetical protein